MKLAYALASPYVRKVTACAIARGIDHNIENWVVSSTDPALVNFNPLSKIPTLLLDDGSTLFDSPVICEYLDSIGDAPPLFPPAGPARWTALRLQAIGDGMMDASQPRRREIALPQDEGRQSYIKLQQSKVKASLDLLEKEVASLGKLKTIGDIAVACALGYLDFRFANEPWRPGHPRLEAWYAEVLQLPPMAKTIPHV